MKKCSETVCYDQFGPERISKYVFLDGKVISEKKTKAGEREILTGKGFSGKCFKKNSSKVGKRKVKKKEELDKSNNAR